LAFIVNTQRIGTEKKKKSFSSSKKFGLGGYRNEEELLWQEKQASALPLGVTA